MGTLAPPAAWTLPHAAFANGGLLGAHGERLSTPALVLDLDAFEDNLVTLARLCRDHGRNARPHVKAHKSIEIARRQVAAGAIGLSATTLPEARVAAAAGAPSLLITTPLAPGAPLSRALALRSGVPDLLLVTDSLAHVAALSAAAQAQGDKVGVLVDVDVGQRRTGVTDPAMARAVAEAVIAAPNLAFIGLQAYYGHLQHVPDFTRRGEAAAAAWALVRACIAALPQPPRLVTGGGTGTILHDLKDSPFNETQAGSYLFMDASYAKVALTPDGTALFRPSLHVRGQVVSANQPDRITINVGWKAVSLDSGPPLVVHPALPGATYAFAGDEHGFVMLDAIAGEKPALGALVDLMPSHCDTTVNLHGAFHAVRGDRLEGVWPIEGRGTW